MEIRLSPFILIMASLFLFLLSEAKTMDPYKVTKIGRSFSLIDTFCHFFVYRHFIKLMFGLISS